MLKTIFRLIYWLGLQKRYQAVDRMRYLKRLSRGANPADNQYFSRFDYKQFSYKEPVYISTHFRGQCVFFCCGSQQNLERKILRQGFSGYPVLDYMADYVKPNTAVLDIGANVGIYAIPLAVAFPDVTVHAFEPNSVAMKQLSENSRLNNLKNLKVHSCAISDCMGESNFYQFDDVTSLSSLNCDAAEIHGKPVTRKVKIETVDHFLMDNAEQKVSFVKIDVQGAELEVLCGARGVIGRDLPIILFEHEDKHFKTPELAQTKKNAIAELLGGLGYRTLYLTRYNHRLLFPVNWKQPLDGDVIALPMGKV